MNIYLVTIVAMLAAEFLLGLVADILNLGALKSNLPKEFAGIFDPETYKKSQDYTSVKTRFGILASFVGLLALMFFLVAGGLNAVDVFVRTFGFNPLGTGTLYIGILFFLQNLLSLPFSIYGTFVIEERFGFNRTTIKTFIADMAKGALLTAITGIPILLVVQALFLYGGAHAWLYAWATVSVVMVGLYFVAPIWIMPLFQKFTPLEDGELKEKIFELARKLSFPLSGIYVIDGSRRSTKANAFFVGFGKHKRIALYDTLVSEHTIPEIVAVLGHEIGHYKKNHTLKGFFSSIAEMGLMFFLFSWFLAVPGLITALGVALPSIYAALVFFFLFYSLPQSLLGILNNYFSRKHEYEADAYARENLGEQEMLISSLKKLTKTNLGNLTPHPFYVFMHYTHPPLLLRFEALRKEPKPTAK